MSLGGALGGPLTAFQYDWNMLPIGQQLWVKQLESYKEFPPLQAPETYNLSGILDQMKKGISRQRLAPANDREASDGRPPRAAHPMSVDYRSSRGRRSNRTGMSCSASLASLCSRWPCQRPMRRRRQKPNILVIMGDDIGYWNISAYNRGMMGYRTPNIDRIAREGAIFTDYYGQQSCTAGRAAFITGQSPIRTGLLKVGLPGAKEGLSEKDPTIADLLKPQGYVTGQFGKNHLGDRNEFLPTVHGFDEFFGNLYHLNAEEEPENIDYPKNPTFKAAVRPARRAEMRRHRHRTPRATIPRFGPWGKQKCEDTGPLTKKRMETVDREFLNASIGFHRSRQPRQASRSSSGSTRAACTSGRTSSRIARARPVSASIPTAWSSMTARSANS